MTTAKENNAAFGHEGVKALVSAPRRQEGNHLEFESQPYRDAGARPENRVVISAAVPQPRAVLRKCQPGNENDGRPASRNDASFPGLRNSVAARTKAVITVRNDKLEPSPADHPGVRHGRSAPAQDRDQGGRVHLTAYRSVGEREARPADHGNASGPAGDRPAPERGQQGRLGRPASLRPGAHLPFPVNRDHHPIIAPVAALVSCALLVSGCLPLPVGGAKTLKSGDLTLAFSGMGRTNSMPEDVKQAGPVAGVVEFRGGLPGDRLESGLVLQIPWHVAWDLKLMLVDEAPRWPALAVQGRLGIIQPEYGGSVLVSKTFGRIQLNLMGDVGRTYERLWRPGGGPFTDESEKYVKNVRGWGAGAEWKLSPVHRLFASLVSWDTTGGVEDPKTGLAFGINEGISYYMSAGLRVNWTIERDRGAKGGSIALRGYILKAVESNSFELGQPGVYRATVLIDSYTRIIRDGKPVGRESLEEKKAVLIQGITLPQPATFLARTIEIQN
jgi:hypothetical protein